MGVGGFGVGRRKRRRARGPPCPSELAYGSPFSCVGQSGDRATAPCPRTLRQRKASLALNLAEGTARWPPAECGWRLLLAPGVSPLMDADAMRCGAIALPDGSVRWRVWAPRPAGGAGAARRRGSATRTPCTRGMRLFQRDRGQRPGGSALRLRPRRRAGTPRSRVAVAARRRSPAVGGAAAGTLYLERPRLGLPTPRRPRPVRVARRHVHPRRDLRRRGPAARRPQGPRRHGRRDHAGGPVPRQPRLGLRRRPPLRPAEQLRRPARPATPRGRLPRPRAGDLPRRCLQPPRPRRQLPAANSARISPMRYNTPWGRAINYDDSGCDAVRDFVLDNVRLWIETYPLRRPAARRRPRHLRRQPLPPVAVDQGDGR